MLANIQNYGEYQELVKTGFQFIDTKTINDDNVDQHYDSIYNILSDGIETPEVQRMKIRVHFVDGKEVTLTIMDYLFNLLLWCTITYSGKQISSSNLYFEDAVTKLSLKKYIDKNFITPNRKTMSMIEMNQTIDRAIGKFRKLGNFQMYLANTVNLEDTIDLMRKYPEFADTIHFHVDGIPLEDVKELGMEATRTQIKYIKNSNHCLRDSFIAGEAISPKQYKEVSVNIGTKPNGLGGVFPHPIKNSFINGGLKTPEEITVESSIGRIAQILQKQNVGESGAFARNLGLNNQDSKLYSDPEYSCDTKNFESVEIKSNDILEMYNMRYYRFTENGIDYLLDSNVDKHLIGKRLLFRSPITCASAAKGLGVCYKCYGDLAYANRDINIGQIASELLSSIYTQILLSAKHLLESSIVKLNWSDGFHDLFGVEFNQVTLKEDFVYRNYKIIIDPDDLLDDEEEEDDESSQFITSFIVRKPDGTEIDIHTSEADQLTFTSDFAYLLDNIGYNDDTGLYEIDMVTLKDLPALFVVDIKNDELSKTMKLIKNIIDNKKSTKIYNRNTILEAFVDTNLSGGIKINAVHFEVLLMNQIRSADDILLLPDWNRQKEQCRILTLNEALTNNRSISVRLQSSKIGRTLTHPSNRKLIKPSNMDLFSMIQPQLFLTNEQYHESEYKLNDDTNDNKINPIYFINGDGGIEDNTNTEENDNEQ